MKETELTNLTNKVEYAMMQPDSVAFYDAQLSILNAMERASYEHMFNVDVHIKYGFQKSIQILQSMLVQNMQFAKMNDIIKDFDSQGFDETADIKKLKKKLKKLEKEQKKQSKSQSTLTKTVNKIWKSIKR